MQWNATYCSAGAVQRLLSIIFGVLGVHGMLYYKRNRDMLVYWAFYYSLTVDGLDCRRCDREFGTRGTREITGSIR